MINQRISYFTPKLLILTLVKTYDYKIWAMNGAGGCLAPHI